MIWNEFYLILEKFIIDLKMPFLNDLEEEEE